MFKGFEKLLELLIQEDEKSWTLNVFGPEISPKPVVHLLGRGTCWTNGTCWDAAAQSAAAVGTSASSFYRPVQNEVEAGVSAEILSGPTQQDYTSNALGLD